MIIKVVPLVHKAYNFWIFSLRLTWRRICEIPKERTKKGPLWIHLDFMPLTSLLSSGKLYIFHNLLQKLKTIIFIYRFKINLRRWFVLENFGNHYVISYQFIFFLLFCNVSKLMKLQLYSRSPVLMCDVFFFISVDKWPKMFYHWVEYNYMYLFIDLFYFILVYIIYLRQKCFNIYFSDGVY